MFYDIGSDRNLSQLEPQSSTQPVKRQIRASTHLKIFCTDFIGDQLRLRQACAYAVPPQPSLLTHEMYENEVSLLASTNVALLNICACIF